MSKARKEEVNLSHKKFDGKEFVTTRLLNAPVELVWKAFTEADRVAKWWGPKGFTMVVKELNFVTNGMCHYHMYAPDGNQMWGRFVYGEINPMTSVEFILSFSDKDKNAVRHSSAQDWPLEIYNLLTFHDENGKTKLVLKGNPYNATNEEIETYRSNFESMKMGFNGTWDQLEEYLKEIISK
jgi:uncharacterized protein YndB with AHSA1/START domain